VTRANIRHADSTIAEVIDALDRLEVANGGRPVKSYRVAAEAGVSIGTTIKVLHWAGSVGLVRGYRGTRGGYVLA
jgi:DNA-binding IscR family transcriptional regulator